MEMWKSIEGYEGLYEISNIGLVRNVKSNHLLKPLNSNGYLVICLCKNGKQKMFRIHRLVAAAFIPNPNNYPCVNHKNEIKTDNRVENLEWCTEKYNCNYGTRNKRRIEKQSKPIRCIENGTIYKSGNEIQKRLGFSAGNINLCCHGKLKSAYGYHWEFV